MSLSLLLDHLPADVTPSVVLFEDGAFAARLRKRGHEVVLFPMPGAFTAATRHRTSIASCAALPSAAAGLGSWFRRRGFDVVHTNTVKAHFAGGIAARSAGVPCVMHLRDILDGRGLAAMRTVGRLCARRSIAITQAVAAAHAMRNTDVVIEPLDLSAFDDLPAKQTARASLGLPLDKPSIGMVGRIARWKGHDRFLRIAARVCEHADAHAVIVGSPVFGDAGFMGELERLAADLKMAGRLSFVPWIDDVSSAYAALDVHCNCSSREPFGRTTIEAAAAGVPTVCFDDGGAAEAIVDGTTGSAVPTGDENAFASAVLQYVLRPSVRSAAGEHAKRAARRFDAGAHARAVRDVLYRAAGA